MFVLQTKRSILPKAVARIVRTLRQRWQFRHVAYPSSWKRRLLWWRMARAPKVMAGRVVFPTFEIASNPTIKLSEIKQRRFNLVDRIPFGCVVVTEEEVVCQVPESDLQVLPYRLAGV